MARTRIRFPSSHQSVAASAAVAPCGRIGRTFGRRTRIDESGAERRQRQPSRGSRGSASIVVSCPRRATTAYRATSSVVSSADSWLGTRESTVGVSRGSPTRWFRVYALRSAIEEAPRRGAGCALNARSPQPQPQPLPEARRDPERSSAG